MTGHVKIFKWAKDIILPSRRQLTASLPPQCASCLLPAEPSASCSIYLQLALESTFPPLQSLSLTFCCWLQVLAFRLYGISFSNLFVSHLAWGQLAPLSTSLAGEDE